MKSFKIIILLSFIISASSCSQIPSKEKAFDREYQVGAYLWFQNSGEYRALCYQAYNLGRLKLDRDLENKHNRKRAVVLDIDETVLDNSYGGADEIQKRLNWSKDVFNRWVSERRAPAIAGAREFIEYAVSRRVEVFYISNRHVSQIEDTFINLKNIGIPVKKENLLFKNDKSSKESRRLDVSKFYDIVLFFGDNLGDFHKDWDSKKSEERRALVDAHRDEFGDKFIILPNPLYGDWENSLPVSKKRSDLLKTIP